MALDAKVVSFLLSDGIVGTTQAITGVGFQPKVVIPFWGGSLNGSNEILRGDVRIGIGFGVSSTSRRCAGGWINDAEGTSETAAFARDDALVTTYEAGNVISGRWDLVSLDADGFTIVVDVDAPTASAVRCHALCIGGADVTDVTIGTFNGSGSAGNQDITGLGFQPDIVMLLAAGTGTIPQNIAGARLSFGAGDGTRNGVLSVGNEDGQGTINNVRYSNDTDCLLLMPAAMTVATRANLSTMLADGFRLNWQTGSTRPVFYLAIKGGSWRVDDVLTATSLTTVVASGFGFQPKGVFVASHGGSASTPGTLQNGWGVSLGAADSTTSRGAHGSREEDAIGTSEPYFSIRYDALYVHQAAGAATVDGLMDLQSFDADGITFVMDDADPTNAFVFFIAMGDTPPGAGGSEGHISLLGVG